MLYKYIKSYVNLIFKFMRPDLCGLVKMLLPHAALKITHQKNRQQPLIWLLIDKQHLNLLLAVLRHHSLFYGARAVDTSGYEISQQFSCAQHQFIVTYVFAIPVWHVKLCIAIPANAYTAVLPASRYFPGFSWGEREISELLGINFLHKLDARRLMLDYAFEGHPLRKNFPTIGFEELAYDAQERWVKYSPLKYRDEIDF